MICLKCKEEMKVWSLSPDLEIVKTMKETQDGRLIEVADDEGGRIKSIGKKLKPFFCENCDRVELKTAD